MKRYSVKFICDKCLFATGWEGTKKTEIPGYDRAKAVLRPQGWMFGKLMLCPDCAKKLTKSRAWSVQKDGAENG